MYDQVIILPTFKCSLSCPSCLRKERDTNFVEKDMTWGEFETAVDQIALQKKEGLRTVTFSGGEPTLWRYLKDAIAHVKAKTGLQVRVYTNAVKRTAEDYKGADVVQISNYGAINRYYIWHLKKTFPGKVVIQNAIHIPYPYPKVPDHKEVLPANCTCYAHVIVRDRVYPCGISSGYGDMPWRNINSNWVKENIENKDNIFTKEKCKTCIANRNVRNQYTIPCTVELAFWDTSSFIFSFKGKHFWLRKVYRGIVKRVRGF